MGKAIFFVLLVSYSAFGAYCAPSVGSYFIDPNVTSPAGSATPRIIPNTRSHVLRSLKTFNREGYRFGFEGESDDHHNEDANLPIRADIIGDEFDSVGWIEIQFRDGVVYTTNVVTNDRGKALGVHEFIDVVTREREFAPGPVWPGTRPPLIR